MKSDERARAHARKSTDQRSKTKEEMSLPRIRAIFPMLPNWHPFSYRLLPRALDVTRDDGRRGQLLARGGVAAPRVDYRSPRIDGDGMSVTRPFLVVLTVLGRGQHVALVLDRTGCAAPSSDAEYRKQTYGCGREQ